MPEQLTEAAVACLDQDNLRLFFKGACHVFAVALQQYRAEENYTLHRVVCGDFGAYHVYAKSGDVIVDVGGLKREHDYLRWLANRMTEMERDSRPEVLPTSKDKLFQVARVDSRRGRVNEWGLFADPLFISQAMERAETLVLESDRYRATLLRHV
jgi:hypothetical protein